jgi:hypothetical protein
MMTGPPLLSLSKTAHWVTTHIQPGHGAQNSAKVVPGKR